MIIHDINNPLRCNRYFDYLNSGFSGVILDSFENIAFYQNGNFHREDGPAVIFKNGSLYFFNTKSDTKFKSYYLNGTFFGTEESFNDDSWIRFVNLQFIK